MSKQHFPLTLSFFSFSKVAFRRHAKKGQPQRDCQKSAQPRATLRLFWIAPGVKPASSQPQDSGCTYTVAQPTIPPLCGKLADTQGHLRANCTELVWIQSAVAGGKAWSFSPALPRRKDHACSVYQPPRTLPEEPPQFFHRCILDPHLKCTEATACLMHSLCQPMPTLPGQVQVGKALHFQMGICCWRMYPLLSRTKKSRTLANYHKYKELNWECHKLNFLLFEKLSTSHGAQRSIRQQTQFSFHCFLSIP